MKAVICPICWGSGKYVRPEHGYTDSSPKEEICHGCGGKGWVTVPEDNFNYSTYIVPETTNYLDYMR